MRDRSLITILTIFFEGLVSTSPWEKLAICFFCSIGPSASNCILGRFHQSYESEDTIFELRSIVLSVYEQIIEILCCALKMLKGSMTGPASQALLGTNEADDLMVEQDAILTEGNSIVSAPSFREAS
jgi:hypothetical protein